MDKRGAIEKFSKYLKSYNIKVLKDLDLGTVRFTMEYLGFRIPLVNQLKAVYGGMMKRQKLEFISIRLELNFAKNIHRIIMSCIDF